MLLDVVGSAGAFPRLQVGFPFGLALGLALRANAQALPFDSKPPPFFVSGKAQPPATPPMLATKPNLSITDQSA